MFDQYVPPAHIDSMLNDPDNYSFEGALLMLEKVDELRPVFMERGYPEIAIGIGINSGMMNVGDMGSVYRRSYTVLGDAVNLSSRLEGLTKFYGIQLVVGETAIKDLHGFLFRHIDRVKVKVKAVDCYEPICELHKADTELIERVSEYHKALAACHFAQDWEGAEWIFKGLQENEPDTLLYKVYLERIDTLREQVLAEDWDGSFTHTSK